MTASQASTPAALAEVLAAVRKLIADVYPSCTDAAVSLNVAPGLPPLVVELVGSAYHLIDADAPVGPGGRYNPVVTTLDELAEELAATQSDDDQDAPAAPAAE